MVLAAACFISYATPVPPAVTSWRMPACYRHRLDATGMLEFQLFRDEHGADLQVARRALRRTRLNTSLPCCCQSSARSSRKRLLNARPVASGEPPGFPPTGGSSAPKQTVGEKGPLVIAPPLAGSLLAPLRCAASCAGSWAAFGRRSGAQFSPAPSDGNG